MTLGHPYLQNITAILNLSKLVCKQEAKHSLTDDTDDECWISYKVLTMFLVVSKIKDIRSHPTREMFGYTLFIALSKRTLVHKTKTKPSSASDLMLKLIVIVFAFIY